MIRWFAWLTFTFSRKQEPEAKRLRKDLRRISVRLAPSHSMAGASGAWPKWFLR